MKYKTRVLVTGILFVFAMVGCTKPVPTQYIVNSKYIDNSDVTTNKEIIQTKEYKKVISKINTIAVQAPDSCKNETSSNRTGDAEAKDVVLKMNCGVEMGAIERSLARAGYQVITWNVLNNMVKDGVTPQQAAKKLEADALLQISSLERSRMLNSGNSRWDRKYTDLNGSKALVDADEMRRLNHWAKVKEAERASFIADRFSATLNANVTYVKTGRSIWFYQWTNNQKLNAADIVTSIQVECIGKKKRRYCQLPKKKKELEVKTKKLQSGSSYAVSKKQDKKNLEKAIYNKLLRETVDDMVNAFKNKTTK